MIIPSLCLFFVNIPIFLSFIYPTPHGINNGVEKDFFPHKYKPPAKLKFIICVVFMLRYYRRNMENL